MAKSKKVTIELEGNSDDQITEEAIEPMNAPEKAPIEQAPVMTKPLFTADNSETYRALLLERPGVPVITNIKEAVNFVEEYGKWNRKVQIAFR